MVDPATGPRCGKHCCQNQRMADPAIYAKHGKPYRQPSWRALEITTAIPGN